MQDKVRWSSAPCMDRGRLRICLVSETFPPEINGVAMTLGRIADGLVDAGHSVQVVTPYRRDRPLGAFPRLQTQYVSGVPIPGYSNMRMGLPAGARMEFLWREYRMPDVIYIATQGPLGFSALNLAARRRIPVVSGFHTNFQQYSRHYRLGLLERAITGYFRMFHNRTMTTLVPTDAQAKIVESFGISNVRVLGRGVDTALFNPDRRNPALRESLGFGPSDLMLLYVGRLAAEKSIDLAVRACATVRERIPSARLVLVGEGPDSRRLAGKASEIIFCGERRGKELAEIYASGDIFVFPSVSETFGNVTLEAMASGLPVVAFDYAAARLAVCSGENGVAVPVGDDEGFVDAVVEMALNSAVRKQFGEAAVKAAQAFSWSGVVGQFESLLREAISRGDGSVSKVS